jgi:hypothetical protein
MTDLLTPPTTNVGATARPAARPAARRRRPHGIPFWTRLFGVTVVPLENHDPRAPQAWVISAGAGTGHFAAIYHDGFESGHHH